MGRLIPLELEPQILATLDGWVGRELDRAGRFRLEDARDFLVSHHPVPGLGYTRPVVARLLEKVGAHPLLRGHGWSRPGAAPPRVTLRVLCDLAQTEWLDEAHVPPKGAPGAGPRQVHRLNRGQVDMVLLGARMAAEAVSGSPERLDAVDQIHLAWDSSARGGIGDWQIVDAVLQHSRETGRVAFLRKDPKGQWTEDLNLDREKKHVAGIRLLCDCAATHRLLVRAHQPPPLTYAAEWVPYLNTWSESLKSLQKNLREIGRSLGHLARVATAHGWLAPGEVDWDTVQADLKAEVARTEGGLSKARWGWIRLMYNELVGLGAIQSKRWPTAHDARVRMVSTKAVAAASEGDFTGWVDSAGQPLGGLLDVPYGLRTWYRWQTAPEHVLRQEGLPSRDRRTAENGRSAGVVFKAARPATRRNRLDDIAVLHGWACAAGMAPREITLFDLTDPVVLEQFAAQRAGRGGSYVERLAENLAIMTTGFLFAQATALQSASSPLGENTPTTAVLNERAVRFWQLADQYQTPHAKERKTDDSLKRKEIQRIWSLWCRDGTSGWHKLLAIRDCLLADAETRAAAVWRKAAHDNPALREQLMADIDTDRVPLATQLQRLGNESGPLLPLSLSWACAIRDATVFTLLAFVPFRSWTVLALDLDELSEIPMDGAAGASAYEFRVPSEKMKGDRGFEPSLLSPESLRDPTRVDTLLATVRPDLLKIYLHPCGARRELLRLSSAKRPPLYAHSIALFPAAMRLGGAYGVTKADRVAEGCRWAESGFAEHFKRILYRYGGVHGLPLDELAGCQGALSPHVVRLLFGSHHCDDRWPDAVGLDRASMLLHHRDPMFTRQRYAGLSERSVAIVPVLGRTPAERRIKSRPGPEHATPLWARKAAELEEGFLEGRITQEDFNAGMARVAHVRASTPV